MDPDFERSVEQRMVQLRERSLREIEAETTAKRLRWLAARTAPPPAPLTPRALFELLFLEYMGLPRADLPVLSESEEEITWGSLNACPT
ncbi:MAG TPA: hypothetical protein VFL83_15375, partial [Anaeromyxobacter sp.]|nr:hypothetical protein [Anaeromyxobacter sp.]